MADHWQSRMWQGLMQWVKDEGYVERRRIVAEQARLKIGELLAEDAVDDLSAADFDRYVWRHGQITDGEKPVDPSTVSIEELQARLESGQWRVEGNRTVGQATHRWGVPLKTPEDEKPALLRQALRELLYSEGDEYERFDLVDRQRAGLSENSLSLIHGTTTPSWAPVSAPWLPRLLAPPSRRPRTPAAARRC